MIKIQWLNAFCTVVETKHFQTAADALFVSQQALSKTILQLEAHLGVELLERQGRRRFQTLTPAGKMFYQRARLIREQVKELEDTFVPIPTAASQQLRLGAILNVAQEIASLVKQYMRKYQGLVPQLYQAVPSQELEQMLLDKKLDIGVMLNPPQSPRLDHHKLSHSPFVIVGHPSLARKSWDKLDYIIPIAQHTDTAQEVLNIWPEDTHPRKRVAEADIATSIQLCCKGYGCVYVPAAFVK